MGEGFSTDDFGSKSAPRNHGLIATKAVSEKEAFGGNEVSKDNGKKDEFSPSQWSRISANAYTTSGTTFGALDSGCYSVGARDGMIFFEKKKIVVDDLIAFPDSVTAGVLEEIEKFWTFHSTFVKYGYLHRRGYLLYGQAGSGKTSTIHQIIVDIVNRGGLVLICGSPSTLSAGLSLLRTVEPERNVVCIFEDLDAIISHHGEEQLLSLLDGENQVDRVLNVASTNHPEVLPKRIISRPRRFDRVIKIGMPSEVQRRLYFTNKLKLTAEEDDLDLWVSESKDFSFAQLAEMVISVKCLGNSFEDTVAIMKKMSKGNVSSKEFEGKLGFGVSD